MADYLNIAGRVRTTAADGVVAEAQEIKDLLKNKSQQEINADVDNELGDRYTKEETYSKEQLDDLITTPDVNYVSVVATDATTAVTDVLPATGEANTIYRVGNWNGTQYDPTMYALFAWNGSAYVCLAVRSFVGEVYDISVNHPDGQGNPTPYADLAAALGTNGANIPADIRRGGMSIKFIQGTVQSSDNKYAQYFLTKNEWSASEADWEKINLEEDVSQLGQKVGNSMTLFSYDAAALGIISLEASFDFDSVVLTNYGNRDKSSDSTAVSQVIRLKFAIGQNTYTYNYSVNGENIRTGYQRLQIPAASASQNVGDVFVGIIWQPYYNTSLNIEIYKGNVKRLLTDYSTKDNATKSVDKIFFDGSDVLGIKSIATDFDFTSATLKRYINRNTLAGNNSQYIIINFVVGGQSIDFIYTDQAEVIRTGIQVITITNSDKTVILVVDWQPVNQSTLNYTINKSAINVLRESQISTLTQGLAKTNVIVEELKLDILPDVNVWRTGKRAPNSGSSGQSNAVFRIDGTNYIAYCLHLVGIGSGDIPVEGALPSNVLEIVSNEDIWFYLSVWDDEDNYLGVYDVATDTFITSYASNRITSVYQYMDIAAFRKKYPNYLVDLNVGDITATSALDVDDITSYIKYRISLPEYQKEELAESELPCNYTGEEMSVFTRGLFIGDSLTLGTFNHNEGGTMEYEIMPQFSYPKQMERFLGISVTNKGDGGKTCTTWWQAHQNDTDYDGHDFCIIQLGVNDVGKQEGGWNAQSTQSILNIIAKVQAENSKIKVFVATIIPSSYYKGVNSKSGGSYDAASQAIRDAIAGLADPNVILVDIARYGHTGETYYSNGHLNALGYQRLAKDYIAYISWIIKNNPEQFTQTAFIGTDMSYN